MITFSWFLSERERKRRERAPSFSLRSTEHLWSDFVGPQTKAHRIDEGYALVLKRKDFDEDPKEEIQGKSKFLGLRRVIRTSYRLGYASRGRASSNSGFSLHFFADFWVKMVERVKGLFRKKNAQNLMFFA